MRDLIFKYVVRDRETGEVSSSIHTIEELKNGNLVFLDENYIQIVEILQFTGFSDRNGVPIFEGDIMFDGTVKWSVEWNKDEGKFEIARYFEENRVSVYIQLVEKWEKIGGIYED